MQKAHTPEIDNLLESFSKNPAFFSKKAATLIDEIISLKTATSVAHYQYRHEQIKTKGLERRIANIKVERDRLQNKLNTPVEA